MSVREIEPSEQVFIAAMSIVEDAAEDHAGLWASDRETCHQCQTWADHAHDALSNQVISYEAYYGRPWEPVDTGPTDELDDQAGDGYSR